MKKQFVFVLLFLSTAFYSQNQCSNMDFEYGDATGWELLRGNVNGQVAQITNTNPTTLANNAFTIFNGGIMGVHYQAAPSYKSYTVYLD